MSWPETAVRMVGSRTPLDLLVIGAWAVTSGAWAANAGNAVQLVTAVLALPLVFVLPGYVFVAALFPESTRAAAQDSGGIAPLERGVLAVFTSLFIVPFTALLVNFSPWLIAASTLLLGLSLVTLLGTAVAYLRRVSLPPDRRFGMAVGDVQPVAEKGWPNVVGSDADAGSGDSATASGDARKTRVLNVVLILAVVAAVGSIAQAVVVTDGASYTETYLLTENESGELVAADYPTNLTQGQASPLVLGVENHRNEPVNYTVIVQLQRVASSANSSEVVETRSVTRFDRRLVPGERALVDHAVTPTMTGDRLRLVYLVYAGAPPDQPSMANADSEVHLWISVHEQGGEPNVRPCTPRCP